MHNTNTPNAFLLAHHNSLADVAGEVHYVSLNNYINSPMWHILVDTVHTIPMFAHHKAYVRDVVQVAKPQITAEDLALNLNISIGESLVILYELQETKNKNETELTR